MNSLTDQQLLHDYASSRSEPAFAELARRHVDLVYSAALRTVCDGHLAEDVTQGVFLALAENARQLEGRPVLSGWLHRTAQNLASKAVRSDIRRRAREEEAANMSELQTHKTDDSWEHIAPQLDAALVELNEPDRDALMLRYFERKSAQEMAPILGISAEAAQKRVNRAVERLRELFAKRGVTVGAGGLVAVVSANAVQSAPLGLAAIISSAPALAGTTFATTATSTTAKIIAMTTLQKTIIATIIAAAVVAGVHEIRQASQLRDEVQTLREQQSPLNQRIQQLQGEHEDATVRLAALTDELAKAKANNLELLKLRNEITALRRSQATTQLPAAASSAPTDANQSHGPSLEEIGRELGMAVVRGEPGAFDKLLAEAQAGQQSFKTNNVGLNDQQRGEAAQKAFASINAAFKVIGDAAAGGSQPAIDALTRALQIPDLNGLSVNSLGSLAGNGDAGALEVLLHPGKYGALLSDTVGALQPAADNGNQKAIDALAVIAKDQTYQALWFLTANGLVKAAAAGNPVAIDALISMSSDTNPNVQNAVTKGLKGAAANQNAKAAEALRAMGNQ